MSGKGRVGVNTCAVNKVRGGLTKGQFIKKLSSRQRGAAGVFERAEALGYKSPFPSPAEAQAFIDKHEKVMSPKGIKKLRGFRSWNLRQMELFPNGRWVTINGEHVFAKG